MSLKNIKLLTLTGLLTLSACSFAAHDLTIHYVNQLPMPGTQFNTMTVPVMQNGQSVNKNLNVQNTNQFTISNIDSIQKYPAHITLHNIKVHKPCEYAPGYNREATEITVRVEMKYHQLHCYLFNGYKPF